VDRASKTIRRLDGESMIDPDDRSVAKLAPRADQCGKPDGARRTLLPGREAREANSAGGEKGFNSYDRLKIWRVD
jgi:hypothetical protein